MGGPGGRTEEVGGTLEAPARGRGGKSLKGVPVKVLTSIRS